MASLSLRNGVRSLYFQQEFGLGTPLEELEDTAVEREVWAFCVKAAPPATWLQINGQWMDSSLQKQCTLVDVVPETVQAGNFFFCQYSMHWNFIDSTDYQHCVRHDEKRFSWSAADALRSWIHPASPKQSLLPLFCSYFYLISDSYQTKLKPEWNQVKQ